MRTAPGLFSGQIILVRERYRASARMHACPSRRGSFLSRDPIPRFLRVLHATFHGSRFVDRAPIEHGVRDRFPALVAKGDKGEYDAIAVDGSNDGPIEFTKRTGQFVAGPLENQLWRAGGNAVVVLEVNAPGSAEIRGFVLRRTG